MNRNYTGKIFCISYISIDIICNYYIKSYRQTLFPKKYKIKKKITVYGNVQADFPIHVYIVQCLNHDELNPCVQHLSVLGEDFQNPFFYISEMSSP